MVCVKAQVRRRNYIVFLVTGGYPGAGRALGQASLCWSWVTVYEL